MSFLQKLLLLDLGQNLIVKLAVQSLPIHVIVTVATFNKPGWLVPLLIGFK